MAMPLRPFIENPSIDATESTEFKPTATWARRRERRLCDPELRARLTRALRRRAPYGELEDVVSETIARATRCSFLPDEDEMFQQYLCGIGRKVASDARQSRRRAPELLEDCDTDRVGSPGLGPVEARLALEKAIQNPDAEKGKGVRWLFRHVAGDSYAAIAGETGLPYATVRKAAEGAREWLTEQVQRSCVPMLVLLFMVAQLKGRPRPRPDVTMPPWPRMERVTPPIAKPGPPDQDIARPTEPAEAPTAPKPTSILPKRSKPPSPTPTFVPPPHGPDDPVDESIPYPSGGDKAPLRGVAQIRHDAQLACRAMDWQACLDGLDLAKAKDPAGDRDESVQFLRHKAEEGLRSP